MPVADCWIEVPFGLLETITLPKLIVLRIHY